MPRIIDPLVAIYALFTLVLSVVFLLEIEQVIHLDVSVTNAIGLYFRACIVISCFGAAALIATRGVYLRRRKQEREKLSHPLDSPDETPAHQ